MIAHGLEYRDNESYGPETIVQKQGPLLLKEGDNYTLHMFMTKTAETTTFVAHI